MYFRFFGNEVSFIDYRLLGCFVPTFGVVFARVCSYVLPNLRINEMNAFAGGSVLRNISRTPP